MSSKLQNKNLKRWNVVRNNPEYDKTSFFGNSTNIVYIISYDHMILVASSDNFTLILLPNP